MIESLVPDLRAVSLHDLLDTDDVALHRGLQWAAVQADRTPALAEASSGGGAERVD
ncbi:hypothetical protein ACGF3G_21110 [Streptomyces sp. NPDC048179]|uniref:hypothetical protein n=1 Tax=Streptomyces sp. NPDC048179 TaxID=3365506 RepID=UPI0037198EB8